DQGDTSADLAISVKNCSIISPALLMGARFRPDRSVWRFDFERATGYDSKSIIFTPAIHDVIQVPIRWVDGGVLYFVCFVARVERPSDFTGRRTFGVETCLADGREHRAPGVSLHGILAVCIGEGAVHASCVRAHAFYVDYVQRCPVVGSQCAQAGRIPVCESAYVATTHIRDPFSQWVRSQTSASIP